MKKNIAIVGCGYWGKNLVRNFYDLDVLSAVCDPNIEIVNHFAKQYNVKKYSFNDVINDTNIKGVVLAVPAKLHASMAIDALNSGKHVFVEKPLAMNENEANLMIKVAKKNNVQLMVGHLLRYHPVFAKLRNLLSCGELGKLNYIFSNRLSFGKIRSHEDVLWSFAPHDLSMILDLAREDPIYVNSNSTSMIQDGIADMASINLQFKSGLKSNILISWLHPYKETKLIVVGSSGSIIFDDNKPWKEKLAFYPFTFSSSKNFVDLKQHEVEYIDVLKEEPLRVECKHFINVIRNNINPLTDGYDGLRVIKVLTALTKSQNINRLVKL